MNLNVIKTVTIRGKAEGIDQAAASVKKLTDATGNLAQVSDTQAKRALSVEKALATLQRRYDQEYRAQQELAKVQKTLDAARAQGLITDARRGELMQAAIRQANQMTTAQRAQAQAAQELAGRAQALSGSLGAAGSVLSAMGPAGLAAAAALGAAVIAFKSAADAALQLADRAGKLKDFSETTGFTVTQLQALEKAGAQVGVSAESVNRGLERFSVIMDDVKQATGPVYDSLRQIDPELAKQISRTESLAEAWDLLADASRKAGLEQRNQLARQVFGRSGIEITRLQGASADAGGLAGLIAQLKQVDLITAQQAEHWDQLGNTINENMKAAKLNIAATFTGPVLTALNEFSRGFLELSRTVRSFDWSSIQTFLGWLQPALTAIAPLLTPFVLAWKAIKGLASESGGAPLKIDVNADALGEAAKKAAEARAEIIRSYNEMRQTVSALGEAATPLERLTLKEKELAAAVAKRELTQEQANRVLGVYKLDEGISQLSRRIGLLGDEASTMEVVRLKQMEINRANQQGAGITRDEAAAIVEKTRALHEMRQLPNQLQFERDQIGRNPIEQQVAARLRQEGMKYEEHMHGATAAMIRQTEQAKVLGQTLESAGTTFADAIVQGLVQGKSLSESIVDGLARVGSQFTQIGTQNIGQGLKGLLSGQGLSGFDPASLGVGAIGMGLSLFAASQQAKKAEEQRIAAARKAWEDARFTAEEFRATLEGRSLGTIRPQIEAQSREARRLGDLAWEASPNHGTGMQGWQDPEVQKITASLNVFVTNLVQNFVRSFGDTLSAYQQGLGPNSPLFKGAERVMEMGDGLKAFLADTEFVTRGFEGQGREIWMAEAAKATQAYALALLKVPDPLSETTQKLMELQGIAQKLPQLLQELGMSAEEAGAAVQQNLTAAINDLRDNFTGDLTRRLNEATSKGFINEIGDLQKQLIQDTTDAAQLGIDVSLAWKVFVAEAQQVVNSAHLTGDAFDELVAMFPALNAGVVEFTGTVQRSAADIAAAQKNWQDQLFVLNQDQSTLAGQLALLNLQAQRDREAEIAAGGQALADLEAFYAQKRLSVIEEFNEKAIEEQRRAVEEAQTFLTGFSRRITEYLAGLLGGSSSPLSPQARLTQAQADFNAQLTLAQGGNRDALNGITQFHQTLLEAAKAYYGSTTAFQSIFNTSTGQLQALPSQVSDAQLIVNAVNSASTSITAATAAMQTALTGVLQTGNLSNIAATLLQYLPLINTSSATGITLAQMQTALGANYTTGMQATIQSVFTELDGNGNGILEKQELMRAATDNIRQTNANINTNVTTELELQASMNTLMQSNNNLLGTMQASLNQLALINTNTNLINQHTAASELYNDATRQNTALIGSSLIPLINNAQIPLIERVRANLAAANTRTPPVAQFATGGVIPPHGLALVSEHAPGGGRFLRAGSEPITVTPHSPVMPFANDNGEVRALRADVQRLEATLVKMCRAIVETEGRGAAATVDELKTLVGVAQDTNRSAKSRRPAPAAA